jgi:hypothetical protein
LSQDFIESGLSRGGSRRANVVAYLLNPRRYPDQAFGGAACERAVSLAENVTRPSQAWTLISLGSSMTVRFPLPHLDAVRPDDAVHLIDEVQCKVATFLDDCRELAGKRISIAGFGFGSGSRQLNDTVVCALPERGMIRARR